MQGDWLGGVTKSLANGTGSLLGAVGIGSKESKSQSPAPTRQPPKAGEDILGTLTTGLRKRVNLVESPAKVVIEEITSDENDLKKLEESAKNLGIGLFNLVTGADELINFFEGADAKHSSEQPEKTTDQSSKSTTDSGSATIFKDASSKLDPHKPTFNLEDTPVPKSSLQVQQEKSQNFSDRQEGATNSGPPLVAPRRPLQKTPSTSPPPVAGTPPPARPAPPAPRAITPSPLAPAPRRQTPPPPPVVERTDPSDGKEKHGLPLTPPIISLQEASGVSGNSSNSDRFVTAELVIGNYKVRDEGPSLGAGSVFAQTSGVGFGNTTISETNDDKLLTHAPPPAHAPQPPEPKPVAPPLPASPPPPAPPTDSEPRPDSEPQPDPASPPAPAPQPPAPPTEAESPPPPAPPTDSAPRADSAPASDSESLNPAQPPAPANQATSRIINKRTASGAADVNTLEEETPTKFPTKLQIIDQNKFNKIFLTPDASNQPESDKISKLFDQTFPNRESPQSGEETATSNDSQFIIAQSDDNKFRLFHQFRGANAQHLTHETIKFEDHRDSGLMAMLFIMNEKSFKRDENGIHKIQEDQIVDFNSVKFLPENTLKTALKEVITEISTGADSEKISDELKDRLLKEVDRNLGHDIGDTAGNFAADASGLAKSGVDLASDILKSVGSAVGLKSEDKPSTNQDKDSERPLEFLAPEKTTIDELRQIAKALESSGKISYSQDTKLASDEPSKKEDNVTKSETNLNQQILDLNTANPPEFDDFKKKVCGFLNQDTMPEDPSNHYIIIKEISDALIKKNDSDKFLSTKQISTLETFREIADSFLIAEDGKKPKPETFKKLSQFFDYPEDKTSHFYDKHFDNLSNDELKMVVIPPEYHPKPVGKAKKFGIDVEITEAGIEVKDFKDSASEDVKKAFNFGEKITSIKYKDINGKETEEQISGLWKKYEDKGLDPVFMITMMIGELSEKGDLTFVISKSTEEGDGVKESTEKSKKDVTLNKKNKTEIDFRTKQGKEIDSPTSKKNTLEGVKSDNTNSRDNSKSPSNFVERFSGPNGNGAGRSL
jgi:hypothetical protein